MNNSFSSIEYAIEQLQNGKMIILVDDENRENEGDLVFAAEFATKEKINFMIQNGRGIICLPMSGQYVDRLNLPPMAGANRCPFQTPFTISIEAAHGVCTGVSAADRAHTINVAIADGATPFDVISPGHVFPLRARDRGVLERGGQTEGSVDLMKLAKLKPAAVICEIINDEGSMSRRDDLVKFSLRHEIPIVSIKDLQDYRIKHEKLIEVSGECRLPVKNLGDFKMFSFINELDSFEHFALYKKPPYGNEVPLVRIHSECITGDIFGSCRCDCGHQLHHSLELISKEGGVLIYLRQEGRGIGLANKLKAYALQESGLDTVDANIKLGLPVDDRCYAVAYQILKYFGIEVLRLLTNNPKKVDALTHFGLKVSERLELAVTPTEENFHYLRAKKEKLGHLLTV